MGQRSSPVEGERLVAMTSTKANDAVTDRERLVHIIEIRLKPSNANLPVAR